MEVVTRTELEEKPEYVFVSSLLICLLQMKCMDNLKDTPYYRQKVKHATNQLVEVLMEYCKVDVIKLRGPENDNKMVLISYIEDCLMHMSTLSTEYYGVILEVIKMLKANPMDVMEKLDIRLVDTAEEEAKILEEAAA